MGDVWDLSRIADVGNVSFSSKYCLYVGPLRTRPQLTIS